MISPRQACCCLEPTLSNLRESGGEATSVVAQVLMEVHVPVRFQCCPALQEKLASPVLLHPELRTSGPRELRAAEEGRTGMTACLAVAEVPWASASDWRRAAVLSALISGRVGFGVADVQLLTSKGQTNPKPTSFFAPSFNPPLE